MAGVVIDFSFRGHSIKIKLKSKFYILNLRKN